jgi:RHS repeat-associated protein
VAAVVLGPVLAAGATLSAVPPSALAAAGATAAVVAATVATATPANAATSEPVLVLLQNGESTAPETTLLQNAGYTVTQATPSVWEGMSASQFEGYAALVIGDPSSGSTCSTLTPTTGTSGSDALGTAWQGAVSGNVAVLGTAPVLADSTAASTLITDAVGYAAARYAAGSGTGLYESLNCQYTSAAAGTSVPLLNGVEGIGAAGGLTVNGGLSCTDSGSVNMWQADASGTFAGFTSSQLALGSWPSPGCPVHEAFDTWPAMFTPLAYDTGSDARAVFTASDGVSGQPYVLLGAPVSGATAALAPSTGGEVPAGTTAGGGANPAAPGVAQASAGDPVNTEDGDFTQADTDLSIPTFGPQLTFTRSYDAELAQQQTQTGTPGALGYGWTDNWASSLATARPVPGDIYTLAGLRTNNGNGGPPASSVLGDPSGIAVNGGNVYMVDTAGNRVQEVPGSTGTQWGIPVTAGDVVTIAGKGIGGAYSVLSHPDAIAFDPAGDLYIADYYDNRIEEIPVTSKTQWGVAMTADDMYTVAGSSSAVTGSSGDGGPATSALLDGPEGIAFDAAADMYITDSGNNRVQEVPAASGTQWGRSMTGGDMYTISGGTSGYSGDGGPAGSADLDAPSGISIDSAGDVVFADAGNNRVQEIAKAAGSQWGQSMTANDIYTIGGSKTGTAGSSGDGGAAASGLLDRPQDAVVSGGNLYIADTLNNRVQEVPAASGTQWGQAMTAADIYTVAGSGTAGYAGDGGTATAAELTAPAALAFDSAGDMYIADAGNNRVREVSAATDDISTYAGDGYYTVATAGDGGAATGAALNDPMQEAFDTSGDVYIADAGNNRIQEIASYSHAQFGIAMTAGDVYTIAGQADGQAGCQCDGRLATQAYLDDPMGVVIDASGNLYIADTGNNRIQEVPAASGTQWGQAMTAGYMYTVAGYQFGDAGSSGDGGPATSATLADSALLDHPQGLAVDKAGDLFIADTGNNRIQEVPVAAKTQWGVSMTAGDMYTIAGSATGAHGSSGDGGAAKSALLYGPGGIAVDSAGDLYVGDGGNNRVQEVAAVTGTQRGQAMTAGDMYTIAGGSSGSSGDGGPATAATLDDPESVAVDPAGDVYFGDMLNNRVQEIAATTGTQWGQSMTANDIYTVAGRPAGASGDAGDGGPATSALMSNVISVSLDPEGDLYITDNANNTIREVPSVTAATIAAAPGQSSSLLIAPGGASPAGTTITLPGGAQVTFYAQNNGTCAAPYVVTGGYCVLPQDAAATLTYDPTYGSSNFTPSPGADTYVYAWTGQLAQVTDPAGDTLNITYESPAPGSGDCPSSATSCQTITAASGQALVIGSNSNGLVTSVTDPLGRTWTYAYNSSEQLTSATDPMGHVTSYTYGEGSTGNSLLASDLLTVTSPNAQPGGPDAGHATVNVYNAAGQVTSQTDPMGFKTTFNYCVNAAAGNCLNPATGTGDVTVADPDGNSIVYDYDQGTLAAESQWTGTTLTSEQDDAPDTTAASTANPSGGSLLDSTSTDGDGSTVTTAFNADGDPTSSTSPSPVGGIAVTTAAYTSSNQEDCSGDAEAASSATCTQEPGPTPVAVGGVITPPSAAPPEGLTYTLYDTNGNQLYSTTGVYPPGSTTASYLKTAYNLFNGNTVTLNGTTDSCAATAPSPSLPCATINGDGVVTQLAYDSAGDLTSSSTPDGNGSQDAVTTATYDGDGEATSATAPDGNISGANTGNYTTVTAWNADGEQTSTTQAGGSGATVTPRVTSYGYDADSNRTTVTDARGYVTTAAYNADDEATLLTNPDGNAALTCYDGDGNAVQTVPPTGVAAGSLTPASCPTTYPAGYSDRLAADATVTTYNVLGKQTQVTTPAPASQSGYETTTYVYDGNGNLTQTSAPPATNGGPDQVTTDTYNSAEQLASQTTGYGTAAAATTSYCYDLQGDKTAVVAPDGNTSGTAPCQTAYPWTVSATAHPAQAAYQTTYGFDSAGDQVSNTTPATAAAPSGATTTATYNAAGDVLTSTDPDGVTATYTYTTAGQPASLSYSGSAAHAVTYTYDADGSMTGTTDATGTSAYQYNPFGEITSSTNADNESVTYSYNADGDATGVTYPLPATATWAKSDSVTYGYDNADQLTSFTDFNGNTTSITNTADGLPATQKLGNTGDTITASYDSTDGPAAISLANSSSTLQSFTYTDAPAGNILTETDTPSSATSPASYGYDARGRVTFDTMGSQTPKDYGYDASGDLTALPSGGTGTYDHDGELTTTSQSGVTTSYTYSADGERLSTSQNSTTTTSATWNGAQELTGYDDSAAQMSGATYQGNGLRASATFTPAGGSSVTQDYLWAGETLLMDSVDAYIYGESSTTPAEQVNLTTGTATYLVTDSLGSVRGTVNSSGALTGTTSYDAWGNPQTSGGLTATTPFGFAGGYTDPDGLVYLVNRYYDPATGQFMSVDPDLAQTQQPYQYTGDNPVNETDPTGDSTTVTENTYYQNNCIHPSCGPNGCTAPVSDAYESPDDISGPGCNLVATELQDAVTLDAFASNASTSTKDDAKALFKLDPADCDGEFADCIDPAEIALALGTSTSDSLGSSVTECGNPHICSVRPSQGTGASSPWYDCTWNWEASGCYVALSPALLDGFAFFMNSETGQEGQTAVSSAICGLIGFIIGKGTAYALAAVCAAVIQPIMAGVSSSLQAHAQAGDWLVMSLGYNTHPSYLADHWGNPFYGQFLDYVPADPFG